jgi:hypothetical protein
MLSLLGFLRDDPNALHTTNRNSAQCPFLKTSSDEVWRRRVCYAEWQHKNDANPVTFLSLTTNLCNYFRRQGSLIGRKFGANSVTVSEWRETMREVVPLPQLKRERTESERGSLKREGEGRDEREEVKSSAQAEVVEDTPPAKRARGEDLVT